MFFDILIYLFIFFVGVCFLEVKYPLLNAKIVRTNHTNQSTVGTNILKRLKPRFTTYINEATEFFFVIFGRGPRTVEVKNTFDN